MKTLILFLISISFSAHAEVSACLGFFYSASNKTVFTVAELMRAESFEFEQAIHEFSDRSIEQVKEDIRQDMSIKRKFAEENSDLLQTLKIESDKLSKTGFFMSPLHQLSYLKALQVAQRADKLAKVSYWKEEIVSKKTLKEADIAVWGLEKEHVEERKEISKKMVNFFGETRKEYSGFDRVDFDLGTWHTLTENEKVQQIGHNSRYKYINLKPNKIIPMLNELSRIYNLPDGKNILAKIFEYSLPEIHSVANTKARGAVGSVIKYVAPFTMGVGGTYYMLSTMMQGMIGNLGAEVMGNPTQWAATLLLVGGVIGDTVVRTVPILHDLPDAPNRIRSHMLGKKLGVVAESRLTTRAARDIHDTSNQAEKIGANDQLISKLDIDFNRLKSELKFGDVIDTYSAGIWGNEFSQALATLSERSTVIDEKIRRLEDIIVNLESVIGKEAEAMNTRNKIRTELEFAHGSAVEAMAQVSTFKWDLLLMSSAYDRYTSNLNDILANQQLTNDQYTLLDNRRELYVVKKKQLTSLASLALLWSHRLIPEIHKVEQMRAVVATDSLLKGL